MRVAIVMGSTSDLPKVEPAIKILKDFNLDVDVRCLSAHRAPEELGKFIDECNHNDTKVILAFAGMAAALPGVIASKTIIPVIGVPLSCSVLDGVDALLSTVQMPSSIPVACVAINGGKNAAYLALQIIANEDENIKNNLINYRNKLKEDAIKTNKELMKKMEEYNV